MPNVSFIFPLEARLTLAKEASASWSYQWGNWEHHFELASTDLQDLEDVQNFEEERWGRSQKNIRGEFKGSWRLTSDSYMQTVWRMRNLRLNQSDFRNVENLYSVGYHYELNRQAEWSVTLLHLNKNTSDNTYTFDDNRISLGYTHFFGKKHKDRRTLFPSK